ncbi:MAG: putative bifunctional diguanylate cyclase/phosphodiesterase [Magnetospiraceae bacterium]
MFLRNRRSSDSSYLERYGSQLSLLSERHHREAALTEQVNRRQQAMADLEHLANHDPLTGLPNRNLFNDRLQKLVSASRRSGRTVGLMYLDLDHFKDVNDTLGHAVGDALLIAVSHRLQSCVRDEDTVARLGGDEFGIIQVGLDYPIDARVQARRILAALEKPFPIDEHNLFTGTSIGITVCPQDADSSEQLQKNADLAMYLAKDEQRNTFRFFDSELNARARRRSYIEQQLRTAVDDGHFAVYLQPKILLKENRVVGAEALARWHHPEQGMISPEEFIPISERTGLINSIGEFMLRNACQQFADWHKDERLPKLALAVNLSAAQFMNRDIPKLVSEVLAETGLPAEFLELEITESAVMQDLRNAVEVLQRLNDLGVSLSIDDFGTGYSSLSYLRQLPVKRMKIDRSFITEVDTDSSSAAIARAVISLGKSLNLEIVAEGVEKQTQATYLRDLDCDEAQGFLYGRPMEPDDFLALVLDSMEHGL